MNAPRRWTERLVTLLLVGLAPLWVQASGGGGHGHGMTWFNWPSEEDPRVGFGYIIINFVVLMAILNKLLFKGLVRRSREHSDRIREDLDQATKARSEAERILAELGEKIGALDEEIAVIKAEAAAASVREHDALIAEAREQAEAILTNATLQAERDAARHRQALEDEIVEQALVKAEAMIRQGIGDADQRRLLDTYVKEVAETRLDQAGGI